jgi:hypothetical protein
MYPNLFIIGAAKSGTSALHYYLGLHPDIHMSAPKEPHYFSRRAEGAPSHKQLTPRQYERLFDSAKPVRGESSVSYSFWPYPSGVPEMIHEIAPDARFIYLVRDPVKRSIQHYFHRIGLGTEHRDLQDVIREPRDHEERYIAASSYATQFEQYAKLFGDERILVVDHADLLARRAQTLRDVYGFLHVDPSFTSASFDVRVNESTNQRRFSPIGSRIAESPFYTGATRWIRPDIRQKLIKPVRNALSAPVILPEVGDDVRAYFAEQLEPEARRFRALTGRRFEHWPV